MMSHEEEATLLGVVLTSEVVHDDEVGADETSRFRVSFLESYSTRAQRS
jgi:hypothetical protein